jgi:iron complex transport system substrate-binding protein
MASRPHRPIPQTACGRGAFGRALGRALGRAGAALVALAAVAALTVAGPARALTLTDDAGHTLTLPGPARRIVSIAPHLTELLFAAGAGERIVGISAWSDWPPEARALPQVGDSALLDLERIVALRPDVVLVWRNGSSAQQLQRLQAAGLPVYASASTTLAHIAGTLRQLGRLAGTEPAAEAAARRFEDAIAGLRARYQGRPPLRVFYQIWHQPLMTIGGPHLLSEALKVCGARNVFAGLDAQVPTVSAEAVVAADPDAIVTSRAGPDGPDHLDAWRRLRHLRAADPQRQILVDPDRLHRATPRMAEGLATLCADLDRLRP